MCNASARRPRRAFSPCFSITHYTTRLFSWYSTVVSRIPWHHVRTKLLVSVLGCGVLLLTVTNICFFRTALRVQREQLRHTLMAIATTGALTIDSDAHGRIPPRPDSVNLPEYRQLLAQLRIIQHANPDIRYVYTMVPSNTPGEWLFVGDSDEEARAQPGYRYNVARFPAMSRALTGPAADDDLVTDEWGTTLSGYAPLYHRDGHPIGIVGVDMSAELVRKTQHLIWTWFVIALVGGLLGAIFLSELVAAWIARPVQQLVHGAQRIAAGDLFHVVEVWSRDEFTELAIAFNQMTAALRKAMQDLRYYALSTIQTLVIAIEAKDSYTRGHSERVRHWAVQIAKRLVLPVEQVEMIERIAVLHDIGKIGIKEAILGKPDRLTPTEYEQVKDHPLLGERILSPLAYSPQELAIVRMHHERYDGAGYPAGARGDQIPLYVAVISVADAFDAMTTPRPYRPQALTVEQAAQELRAHSGTQFHPDAVRAFLDLLREQGKLERG